MDTPVKFTNAQGEVLYGLLHRPDTVPSSAKSGVVILNSGLGQRNYAHGLYVTLARQFAAQGYQVLRFDFHGVGESDGRIEPGKYIEIYNDIQNGLFVSDTEAALDFFARECKVENVALLGICGGAITALMALARFPEKVSAGILIGLPVTLDKPDRPYLEELTTAQAKLTLLEYLPKLLSPRAWVRLLTFQSDIRVMFRSIFLWLRSRFAPRQRASSRDWARLVTHPAFNPHVIPAFLACLQRRKKLALVFAECDRLRWEFESEFQEKCLVHDSEFVALNEIFVVPEANHEFQWTESKQKLMNVLSGWLSRNFPASPGA